MWYRCEAMGRLNQVDQLKLLQEINLMKTVNFVQTCQNQKNQIVYHKSYTLAKMSYFSVFLSRITLNSLK